MPVPPPPPRYQYDADSIRRPYGARLCDASTVPLELLEDEYYSGAIDAYDEDELFHVTVVKRLFAENMRLHCLLACRTVEIANAKQDYDVLSRMVRLSPTKLLPNWSSKNYTRPPPLVSAPRPLHDAPSSNQTTQTTSANQQPQKRGTRMSLRGNDARIKKTKKST
jgi:hypothetical protein